MIIDSELLNMTSLFSYLNVPNASSTVHIILYDEVPIDQRTVTVRTFPLLVQCWTEGNMSLRGLEKIGSRTPLAM